MEDVLNTKMAELIKETVINKSFNLTLHDGESGGSDDDSTKVKLNGKFNIGNLTLGSLINKAISQAVISYQNKNRENFTLLDNQTVSVTLIPERAKMTPLDKTAKLATKMSNDERLSLIEKLKSMNSK